MKSTLRDTVALSCKTSTFVDAPTNYLQFFLQNSSYPNSTKCLSGNYL